MLSDDWTFSSIFGICFNHCCWIIIWLLGYVIRKQGFPGGTSVKEPICHCRRHKRHGFDPWKMDQTMEDGRSPGEGHSNPLQYSCLENPMDRGACWVIVHRVTKSQTWLKQLNTHNNNCLLISTYFSFIKATNSNYPREGMQVVEKPHAGSNTFIYQCSITFFFLKQII